MANTFQAAVCIVALPLASLQAQTIVATRALCPNTYLSDPSCWLNGVSPISTDEILYSIYDTLGGTDIYLDLPNTFNSFQAPTYAVYAEQDLTVLNRVAIYRLSLNPTPGATPINVTMGSPLLESSVLFISMMPGTSLTLVSPVISSLRGITFGGEPIVDPSGTANLTIDSPTILSAEFDYTYLLDGQTASINLPSTTSVSCRRSFVLGRGPVTINAPVLEEITGAWLVVGPSDPGFTFIAPNLRHVNGISFETGQANPTWFKPPLLDVGTLVSIDAEGGRSEPLVITQIEQAASTRISFSGVGSHVVMPNLSTVGTLQLRWSAGTAEFPDLLEFNGLSAYLYQPYQSPDVQPVSLIMPLADVTRDADSISLEGGTTGTFERVDLRSLSRLPSDSKIRVTGGTVRFDSLAEINDATVFVHATFDAPFPPITSLDRSALWVGGETQITITDPLIKVRRERPFSAGPETQMTFSRLRSIHLGPESKSSGHTLEFLQLSVMNGRIDMPLLTSVLAFPGRPIIPGILTIAAAGEDAEINLPILTTVGELRVGALARDLAFGVENTGSPIVSLGSADIAKINVDKTFRGRLIMPAQSTLHENTILGGGQAFVMRGVQTVNYAAISLAANPGSPFLLDLSGATQFTATTINATGTGTVDIPTVTPGIDITLVNDSAGGPVRFTGDVLSSSISGPSTIQIEGDFLPQSNNTDFPLTVEMIGSGEHSISPLRSDVGPDTAHSRRGLTVGAPNTKTHLHLVPRPDSDFEGAFYLGESTKFAAGIRIRHGSVLYLNDVPAYLWRYDPDTNSEHYVPLASLIPPGSRCVEYDGGLLCLRDCRPDLNNDGVLDNGDIGTFVTFFLAGDPAADFNDDTILDSGDIQAFVAAFLAGC